MQAHEVAALRRFIRLSRFLDRQRDNLKKRLGWPAAIVMLGAIAGITTLSIIAIMNGINGILANSSLVAIAALGGFGTARIIEKKD